MGTKFCKFAKKARLLMVSEFDCFTLNVCYLNVIDSFALLVCILKTSINSYILSLNKTLC